MKNFKSFTEDKTLKDIIKREKSDDLILVKLSDDGDGVIRIEKDKLAGYLKKGWEKIK